MEFEYLRAPDYLYQRQPLPQQITSTYKGRDRRYIFFNVPYTEKEQKMIKQFREIASKQFQQFNYDDKTLLRYIYSGDLSYDDGLEKLKVYHQWMHNPYIQNLNPKAIEILKQGAIYNYGRDLRGRPIIILNIHKIDLTDRLTDDYLCAMNTLINLVIEKMFIPGIIQKYLFIIDMGGKNFTSLPFQILKSIISKMANVYSLRLGVMVIINVNYFIKLGYRVFKRFISEQTTNKMTWLSTQQLPQLTQFIDKDQLQIKYGGTQSNIHSHSYWPPKVPKIQQQQINQDQSDHYYSIISQNQYFKQIERDSGICCSMQNTGCTIY